MPEKNRSEILNSIKQLFYDLSQEEQNTLLVELKIEQILNNIPAKKITCCPHCQATHFVKNGKRNGNQRYLCRECQHSFVEQTGSILSHSKKTLDVWLKYIDCMMDKFSVRKCAAKCEIQPATAFVWRHKILDALQNMMEKVQMRGIVQADETLFNISYKGNHRRFTLPREAHHRGEPAKKRGISKEQVCVPVGINTEGLSVAKISNLGRASCEDLKKVLAAHILNQESILVTDSLASYRKFARELQFTHVAIPTKRHVHNGFNIQRVNSYHSKLKALVGHFCGVATKYLNNYVVYHNFINIAKGSDDEKREILFEFIRNTPCVRKTATLSHRPAIPI